jgi:hypothetical protein
VAVCPGFEGNHSNEIMSRSLNCFVFFRFAGYDMRGILKRTFTSFANRSACFGFR